MKNKNNKERVRKKQTKRKRKKQVGGALLRKRGPTTVDKIAWVLSNFVTPAPSFAQALALLGGQALKGVVDNVKMESHHSKEHANPVLMEQTRELFFRGVDEVQMVNELNAYGDQTANETLEDYKWQNEYLDNLERARYRNQARPLGHVARPIAIDPNWMFDPCTNMEGFSEENTHWLPPNYKPFRILPGSTPQLYSFKDDVFYKKRTGERFFMNKLWHNIQPPFETVYCIVPGYEPPIYVYDDQIPVETSPQYFSTLPYLKEEEVKGKLDQPYYDEIYSKGKYISTGESLPAAQMNVISKNVHVLSEENKQKSKLKVSDLIKNRPILDHAEFLERKEREMKDQVLKRPRSWMNQLCTSRAPRSEYVFQNTDTKGGRLIKKKEEITVIESDDEPVVTVHEEIKPLKKKNDAAKVRRKRKPKFVTKLVPKLVLNENASSDDSCDDKRYAEKKREARERQQQREKRREQHLQAGFETDKQLRKIIRDPQDHLTGLTFRKEKRSDSVERKRAKKE